jgi:hypothetical protein
MSFCIERLLGDMCLRAMVLELVAFDTQKRQVLCRSSVEIDEDPGLGLDLHLTLGEPPLVADERKGIPCWRVTSGSIAGPAAGLATDRTKVLADRRLGAARDSEHGLRSPFPVLRAVRPRLLHGVQSHLRRLGTHRRNSTLDQSSL